MYAMILLIKPKMNSQLAQNNYIHIPNFITSIEAHKLANELIEYSTLPGNEMSSDPQVPNSLSKYNFLPFTKFLVRKMQNVSEILEEEILPTYCYTRIYKNADVLTRHRDRSACEISITLNLKKDVNWPIWFQKPNGEEVSLELNPGDAVMYLGETADHWRNAYEGKEYVQLFLHYVRAHGSKSWAVFDQLKQQRPTLEKGQIPVVVI